MAKEKPLKKRKRRETDESAKERRRSRVVEKKVEEAFAKLVPKGEACTSRSGINYASDAYARRETTMPIRPRTTSTTPSVSSAAVESRAKRETIAPALLSTRLRNERGESVVQYYNKVYRAILNALKKTTSVKKRGR